jgi:hypothetical protein
MTRILQERVLTDTEIEDTLSKANESLRKLEKSTQRIKSALHHPMTEYTRLKVRRLSDRLLAFAVVCIVAIIGIFTTVFLNASAVRRAEVMALNDRIDRLEHLIEFRHPLQQPDATLPTNEVMQPSRNLVK